MRCPTVRDARIDGSKIHTNSGSDVYWHDRDVFTASYKARDVTTTQIHTSRPRLGETEGFGLGFWAGLGLGEGESPGGGSDNNIIMARKDNYTIEETKKCPRCEKDTYERCRRVAIDHKTIEQAYFFTRWDKCSSCGFIVLDGDTKVLNLAQGPLAP